MPWRISLDYSYNDANQLIQGTSRQKSRESWPASDGASNGLGVRNRYEKMVAGVSYDYSNTVTAGMTIPYVRNERWEDHHHYSDYTSQGLGDITIYGKFWINKEKDAFNAYVDLALGVPTGASNEKFTLIPEKSTEWSSKYKAAYIQAGLGQWVPILALGFEKNIADRTALYGRTQYSDPQGTNNADYKSESNLVTNLGVGYTFEKSGQSLFGVSGQFDYIYARFRKDQNKGVDVGNTGGTWLGFTPGGFYSPDGGKLSFTASVPLGLTYDVNSIQTYAPWALNLGISRRF
ncbi:MAG: hypothetical protein HQK86_01205 [Nitrospinae bacterium]|nr:hypothetical protein [Nitrospinota bacterium]MBF0633801.1 hypothetical protein [Nitrospinota bacterium]